MWRGDFGVTFTGVESNLSSYCVSQQIDSLSSFLQHPTSATGPASANPDLTIVYGGAPISSPTTTRPTVTVPATFSSFIPTYTSPCCGTCCVTVNNAQVFYWPTPAPDPGVTSVVNEDGYTLYALSYQKL